MVGTGESVVTFSERAGLGSGEGDSTVGVPQAARARIPRYLPSWANFFCSGVWLSFSLSSRLAIRPISVSIPVAVTTATAVP